MGRNKDETPRDSGVGSSPKSPKWTLLGGASRFSPVNESPLLGEPVLIHDDLGLDRAVPPSELYDHEDFYSINSGDSVDSGVERQSSPEDSLLGEVIPPHSFEPRFRSHSAPNLSMLRDDDTANRVSVTVDKQDQQAGITQSRQESSSLLPPLLPPSFAVENSNWRILERARVALVKRTQEKNENVNDDKLVEFVLNVNEAKDKLIKKLLEEIFLIKNLLAETCDSFGFSFDDEPSSETDRKILELTSYLSELESEFAILNLEMRHRAFRDMLHNFESEKIVNITPEQIQERAELRDSYWWKLKRISIDLDKKRAERKPRQISVIAWVEDCIEQALRATFYEQSLQGSAELEDDIRTEKLEDLFKTQELLRSELSKITQKSRNAKNILCSAESATKFAKPHKLAEAQLAQKNCETAYAALLKELTRAQKEFEKAYNTFNEAVGIVVKHELERRSEQVAGNQALYETRVAATYDALKNHSSPMPSHNSITATAKIRAFDKMIAFFQRNKFQLDAAPRFLSDANKRSFDDARAIAANYVLFTYHQAAHSGSAPAIFSKAKRRNLETARSLVTAKQEQEIREEARESVPGAILKLQKSMENVITVISNNANMLNYNQADGADYLISTDHQNKALRIKQAALEVNNSTTTQDRASAVRKLIECSLKYQKSFSDMDKRSSSCKIIDAVVDALATLLPDKYAKKVRRKFSVSQRVTLFNKVVKATKAVKDEPNFAPHQPRR